MSWVRGFLALVVFRFFFLFSLWLFLVCDWFYTLYWWSTMHGLHFLSQETRKWLSCLCQIESVLLWFLLQSFVIWRDSSLEKCPGFKVFSPWLFSVCGCFRWSMMHDYTSCVKKHSNNCLEMSYRICFVVVICPFYFVKLLSLRSVASVFSGWLFFVFIISNYLPSFSVSFFFCFFLSHPNHFFPSWFMFGFPQSYWRWVYNPDSFPILCTGRNQQPTEQTEITEDFQRCGYCRTGGFNAFHWLLTYLNIHFP